MSTIHQRFKPLPIEFYLQPTLQAAEQLIGQLLVRWDGKTILTGRIVETEAYTSDDPASHAYRRKTARNASMFGLPGRAYVYFIYGLYHCLNVVTAPEGQAEAVLIRAVEPLEGLETMQARRGRARVEELASGPARLCQAFAIDRSLDGEDMVSGERLFLAHGPGPSSAPAARTRIGLSHEAASLLLWRFIEPGSRFISKP